VAYRPSALAALAAKPMPALVDPVALAASQSGIDGNLVARFNLADTRRFSIAGTVRSFPGIDGSGFTVVDLGSWQLAAYGASGSVPSPTAWWLATDGANDAGVVAALRTGEFPLAEPRSLAAETAARLNNPIADAVLGSLDAVGAGTLLIALLGVLAASAQGGRTRRGEVAVVRAQGLAGRGLAGWMLAEEAFPVAVGVAAGVALGWLTAALVVPALVHALDGVPAVPPVVVEQPIDLALAVMLGGVVLVSLLTALRLRATGAVSLAVTLRSDAPGAEA
jgi:predicted lysophospholipase L1 biosynthesis ABC-type transport system permease subunit